MGRFEVENFWNFFFLSSLPKSSVFQSPDSSLHPLTPILHSPALFYIFVYPPVPPFFLFVMFAPLLNNHLLTVLPSTLLSFAYSFLSLTTTFSVSPTTFLFVFVADQAPNSRMWDIPINLRRSINRADGALSATHSFQSLPQDLRTRSRTTGYHLRDH